MAWDNIMARSTFGAVSGHLKLAYTKPLKYYSETRVHLQDFYIENGKKGFLLA